MADVAERKPRKLVTNISDVIRPHWSRDGKWIYFRSDEAGRTGIYRCPASGGDAIALSKDIDGGQSAGVFRWEDALFCKQPRQIDSEKLLCRRSQVRSPEVDGLPRVRDASFGPSLQVASILFLPRRPDLSATLISPPGRYARSLKWTRISVAACQSLPMADGSSIHKLDDVNGDIMLVDHFH